MDTNIETLSKWLLSKNEEIEDITRKEMTLMDIVDIALLENHWSKIYQFFLSSPSKEIPNHGFGDVFIRGLEKVLRDKGLNCEDGWLKKFDVLTEYPCKSTQGDKTTYKRIDILLKSEQKAIIIENKVRHVLDNNDLKLYAETVLNEGCKDIKLIVLSRFNMEDEQIYKDKVRELDELKDENITIEYANITHVEYMKAIEEILTQESIEKTKYYDLYKDFYQNIMNQTNVMTDEEYDFFCKNYEKVRKVSEIYKKIIKSYEAELKNNFKDSTLFNYNSLDINDNLFIQLRYKEKDDVLLSIFFDRLWKADSPYITVILELQGKAKQKILNNNYAAQIKQLRDKINDSEIKYHDDNGVELKKDEKNKWMHYASWDKYDVQKVAPKDFAKYLKGLINEDFSMYKLGKGLIDILEDRQNE